MLPVVGSILVDPCLEVFKRTLIFALVAQLDPGPKQADRTLILLDLETSGFIDNDRLGNFVTHLTTSKDGFF
jgi:hypothetical protein